MPKAPSFIEGVIELRGTILPIIDLRKRFDLPPAPATRATKFLIVAIDPIVGPIQGQGFGSGSGDRWILGVIVDRVLEVVRIARDEIRATPAVAVDESARFFAGVCHHRDRIVMLWTSTPSSPAASGWGWSVWDSRPAPTAAGTVAAPGDGGGAGPEPRTGARAGT